MNELDEEQEAALDEALAHLPNLLSKRRKLLDEREKELKNVFEKLEKEKKTLGCGNDGDVIHLNVGGTLMATLRSTLTYVEDSMLAARFSGRWDESIAKDKDGNFFIDQRIELFQPVIDFFRDKQNQTPLTDAPLSLGAHSFGNDSVKYADFKRMVEYFGVTPGIYPVSLIDYTTAKKERIAVSGPSSIFKVAFTERKICGLVPSGHQRRITGFEMKIGEAVNLQIGWVKGPIIANSDVSNHSFSIALDLARGGITCNRNFSSVENNIQTGSFVKCKNYGKEWFIDGEKLTGDWESAWATEGVVPAISCKGEWTITAVELGP